MSTWLYPVAGWRGGRRGGQVGAGGEAKRHQAQDRTRTQRNGFRSAEGRGLHSSTSQLKLSRSWSLKPQQDTTFQLNLGHFCHQSPIIARRKCSRLADN